MFGRMERKIKERKMSEEKKREGRRRKKSFYSQFVWLIGKSERK